MPVLPAEQSVTVVALSMEASVTVYRLCNPTEVSRRDRTEVED
jgi:hypothetical protein